MQCNACTTSPLVRADPEAGLITLAGESYPENSFEFYRPIGTWMAQFLERDGRALTLEARLAYLNENGRRNPLPSGGG
jgi:hypothetical protein